MQETIEEERKAETKEKGGKSLLFQSSFPHSLAWLPLNLSSVALHFPEFLPFFLFFLPFSFLFLPPFSFLFLPPHSSVHLYIPITPLWWFPQYSLTFPSFSLVAAFHSSSFFFFYFRSSVLFSYSSVFFFVFFLHIFTFFLISVVSMSTQFSSFISFALYKFIITMLFLFLWKFLNFYLFFFFLLFFFSSSSLSSLFLHIPVWRFPQFSLSLPGSGAPRSRTLSIPDLWSRSTLPHNAEIISVWNESNFHRKSHTRDFLLEQWNPHDHTWNLKLELKEILEISFFSFISSDSCHKKDVVRISEYSFKVPWYNFHISRMPYSSINMLSGMVRPVLPHYWHRVTFPTLVAWYGQYYHISGTVWPFPHISGLTLPVLPHYWHHVTFPSLVAWYSQYYHISGTMWLFPH